MHLASDEQIQVSQVNESKDTQTSASSAKLHGTAPKKYTFTNPYAILERAYQGEQFLKFLQKQNLKLDLIYTNFLQHLQKYADQFLLSLQDEHGLYSIYRRDLIWYITLLQESINDQRTKVKVFQEANKNFALFGKHFHQITRCKYPLEEFLDKGRQQNSDSDHSGRWRESWLRRALRFFSVEKSAKFAHQFFQIYHTSSIQLRSIEQQRLLAIREHMRLLMNLTMPSALDNPHHLFTSNDFDELLKTWDEQYLISIDHWSQFPRRSLTSRYESSANLLEEIKQVIDDYYQRRWMTERSYDCKTKGVFVKVKSNMHTKTWIRK